MSEKLFTEFPPVTTEQWEEVINKDLKGADYDKKLVWKTQEVRRTCLIFRSWTPSRASSRLCAAPRTATSG